jgi:hypothetical protein
VTLAAVLNCGHGGGDGPDGRQLRRLRRPQASAGVHTVTKPVHIPANPNDFSKYLEEISEIFDANLRLPDWPFRVPSGYVSICQFDDVLGSRLVPVLEALSTIHGDTNITLVVLEPDPSYYLGEYSYLPGFRVERESLTDGYWAGLSYEPEGDPTGAIAYTANVVAVVGSSRAWAVWGQRDWELSLVLAPSEIGEPLRRSLPFLNAREARGDFRGPSGWVKPLSETEMATFLRNVEERGAGRRLDS